MNDFLENLIKYNSIANFFRDWQTANHLFACYHEGTKLAGVTFSLSGGCGRFFRQYQINIENASEGKPETRRVCPHCGETKYVSHLYVDFDWVKDEPDCPELSFGKFLQYNKRMKRIRKMRTDLDSLELKEAYEEQRKKRLAREAEAAELVREVEKIETL